MIVIKNIIYTAFGFGRMEIDCDCDLLIVINTKDKKRESKEYVSESENLASNTLHFISILLISMFVR